jgi:hypothetical protein
MISFNETFVNNNNSVPWTTNTTFQHHGKYAKTDELLNSDSNPLLIISKQLAAVEPAVLVVVGAVQH